jgi:hypothetical protein
MNLNKQWHQAHPMPKNPALEQRIAWHVAHEEHCGCRKMPESIRKEIKKRKKN